jgi:predicted phage terminase large subunit-like protein
LLRELPDLKQLDLDQAYTEVEAELMRLDFRRFVAGAWPIVETKEYQSNWHIDAICDHLVYVTLGDIKNLIINIPPRMSKSLSVTVFWPVWEWLDNPKQQYLCASYAGDLAIRDAGKSRHLIESAWFKVRYGDRCYLDPANNRKDRYVNNHGGYRIATSVGGKATGEGGSRLVIDDPHNMKEVYSDAVRNDTIEWWDNSMRSRLNDPIHDQKIMVGQRSHDADLFGHVIDTEPEAWVVLMLPMEYDPTRRCITYPNPKGLGPDKTDGPIFEDPRQTKGELLNPMRFGGDQVRAERKAMANRDYSAQYQQDPTSGGGLIFKKSWWRQWCFPDGHQRAGATMPMPEFFEIVSVYDTAFEEGQDNDFSARTTWGLFVLQENARDEEKICALLLESFKDRLAFYDLKQKAIEHRLKWEPNTILIERKGSGISLLQELRRELRKAGVKTKGVNPGTRDKVFRANMVQQILKDGHIWYLPKSGSYDVINECAKFPTGEHDDLVDTVIMLLAYIRRKGLVVLPDDEKTDEINLFAQPTKRRLYG